MKRILPGLLALTMLWGVLGMVPVKTFGEEAPEEWETEDSGDFEDAEFDDDDTDGSESGEAAPAFYTGPEYEYDHLVVGNPTALSGNFTTQMWGYSTSDLDVTALVNGYNLVSWHFEEGNFQANASVVTGMTAADDPEGDRTYILSLRDNLRWSDGMPITAADYAFAILLSAAPQVRALGGDTENYLCLEGMDAYRRGDAPGISGVEVISSTMLSLTIDREYRPFFYELGQLWCYPMPIHVIAPGCSVVSGEDGTRIEGPLTASLLADTLLDAETGYVSHPSVVSGPYRLVSYDEAAGVAEFEINGEYLGNEDGVRPTIQRLTLQPVSNDLMIEQLGSGEIGLINKAVAADPVMKGIQLAGTQNYAMMTYARTGQSFISFNCEKPAVSSQAVRQAIACCLDKDETVAQYTGGFGTRMDGYYGIAQWMYQVMTGAMAPPVEEPGPENGKTEQEYEKELAAWEALTMDDIRVYQPDVQEAVRLLEEDGWTLNRDGDPYMAGQDEVRCRQEGRELVSLSLELAVPRETRMGSILEETFLPNLEAAGIRVTVKPMEWQELLRQYYRQEARTCHMMFLASNFNEVFDPWPTFDPADAETGMANYTGIRDRELYEKARDMSQTEPGNSLEYMTKWIAFQQRFQEAVPAIPVYGNAYFDFYTRYLKNYLVNSNVTWSEAIVSAYMSDPGIAEETEDGQEQLP